MTHNSNVHLRLQAIKLFETGMSVAQVCRMMGRSRTWFYKWLARYRNQGEEGLFNCQRRVCPANRTPAKAEQQALKAIERFPTYGPQRIAHILQRQGLTIGRTAVWGVLKRNRLNRRKDRLEWTRIRCGQIVTESELDTARARSKSRHIQADRPGELVGLDTFYIGCLKGVGRIYQMTACDCATSFAWARLYTAKTAQAALDFLEHILANSHGVKVTGVLTDNGKEFTTHLKPPCHDFEFELKQRGIRHRYTQVKHPWTNGFVERLNRTTLEEFYQVVLRRKRYRGVKQLQTDLDRFLKQYNFKRPHQGYRLKGSTPAERFIPSAKAA